MFVLDHGYVDLVETWGSDERIIEAARMSTAKGFQGWGPRCDVCNEWYPGSDKGDRCPQVGCPGKMTKTGDEQLLRFLWEHKHTSPFEMAGATFEVKAPIFVFREWHRHRTQSYNEMSARYTPLPNENYLPTAQNVVDRIRQASSNKQERGLSISDEVDLANSIDDWLYMVSVVYQEIEKAYQFGLSHGIPKELARLVLPVARYSRMRASANLLNWIRFLRLRLPKNAQWEIRQYADAVRQALLERFPRTMELFLREP